jgi:cytochrome b6-f complex iron-sulfur subunit
MAEKISELTGEAREQRIAELKRKMMESAAKAKAAYDAGIMPAQAFGLSGGGASAPAAVAEVKSAPVAVAAQAAPARPARESTTEGNGVAPKPKPAAVPAPAVKAPPKPKVEEEPVPVLTEAEMNRREFLMYSWVGALGLLGIGAGVASFQFMYPRFRAGEFGGEFFVPQAELPDPTAAPIANTTGKFWLVGTDEGETKALYMVCTHLGCLYKWEASNSRFECPCHGSKFTHDGHYIEGPAPRSLDVFETRVENDLLVVDTGKRIVGAPATESPARVVA